MLIRSFALVMMKCAAVALIALAVSGPAVALSDEENKTLKEVNSYFNSVKTMHGDFVQFGPDGSQTEGKFYLARPGKVRFYYSPPARLDIIADGKSVSVKDRKMATQDIWPLNQTPLRFLLADNIDLQQDAEVTNVLVEEDLITVTLTDQTTFNSGMLTLIFDAKSYDLKQWTVTDAQGFDTSVAVYNVVANGPTNPDLFKIDYLANVRERQN
ncbi:MAG: outer membrane lipoprotein carrier protein LolA [Roseibium sp.]|nr:outer membrane lipoprotein carrier protein LolA [Roseibium sp.]